MKPTDAKTPELCLPSRICSHRTRTGRRCRFPVSENSALCFRHAALRETPDADFASAFSQLGDFRSAVTINEFLSKLLALLVQNRISTRRASVLAYITNQLLRTLPVIEHELNPDDDKDPFTAIIFDAPRPDRSALSVNARTRPLRRSAKALLPPVRDRLGPLPYLIDARPWPP